MARGRAHRTAHTPAARRAQPRIDPTAEERAAAQVWLARTQSEVGAEYSERLERMILRRAGVQRRADLPGSITDPEELRLLARDLAALDPTESGQAQALAIRQLADPDATRATTFYHPRDDRERIRAQDSSGLGALIGERAEVAERTWSHCRYAIEHGQYSEAIALADAWRAAEHIPTPRSAASAEESCAFTRQLLHAWAMGLYSASAEEGLRRLGYADAWDLERAAWSRSPGALGEFGDPHAPHRRPLYAQTGVTLEEFERMARAAIDRPDLFGPDGPAQREEHIALPLDRTALPQFIEEYADDPAFLGWSVRYATTPNVEPFEHDNPALWRQAVYITGSLRAQTPEGERTIDACVLLGRYYTDEPDVHLATDVAAPHLAELNIRSGVTAPIDDTHARAQPSDTPFGRGRAVERGEDMIRTPRCDHPGATWQPAPLYDRSGHVRHHDTLSLDCPHCGARRLAIMPVHRAEGEEIANVSWYLRREHMHTLLAGRDVARTLADLRKRDGYADMNPHVHLPALAPLTPGDDLTTTLFG